MGAAGSISLSSVTISNTSTNSQGVAEEEPTAISIAPISPTGLASDIILPGPVYKKINKALVEKCKQSWLRIASSNSFEGEGGMERGFASFCGTFFFYMEELDTDADVLIKFQPRPSSFCVDRDALLLRVVNFVLSIPSDNFKVKSKIRALGRAHARVGIVDKHFEMFTKALLKSIANRLGALATTETIGAWLDLLSFAIHQLTFDKINFKSHLNTDKDAEYGKDIEIGGDSVKQYEEMTSKGGAGAGVTSSTAASNNGGDSMVAHDGDVERKADAAPCSNAEFDFNSSAVAETKEITPQFARSVLEETV